MHGRKYFESLEDLIRLLRRLCLCLRRLCLCLCLREPGEADHRAREHMCIGEALRAYDHSAETYTAECL